MACAAMHRHPHMLVLSWHRAESDRLEPLRGFCWEDASAVPALWRLWGADMLQLQRRGHSHPPAPACMGHKRSIRQSELTIFTRCATEAEAQLKTENS